MFLIKSTKCHVRQKIFGYDVLCFLTFQTVCETNDFDLDVCKRTIKAEVYNAAGENEFPLLAY